MKTSSSTFHKPCLAPKAGCMKSLLTFNGSYLQNWPRQNSVYYEVDTVRFPFSKLCEEFYTTTASDMEDKS